MTRKVITLTDPDRKTTLLQVSCRNRTGRPNGKRVEGPGGEEEGGKIRGYKQVSGCELETEGG